MSRSAVIDTSALGAIIARQRVPTVGGTFQLVPGILEEGSGPSTTSSLTVCETRTCGGPASATTALLSRPDPLGSRAGRVRPRSGQSPSSRLKRMLSVTPETVRAAQSTTMTTTSYSNFVSVA